MSRRIAIVTDIHANVPALAAALGRIDELGVEDVYCPANAFASFTARPAG